MLTSLWLKNFTLFADTTFKFGSNLNVIIGENGLGKTHILKAAYSLLAMSSHGAKKFRSNPPTKTYLQTSVAHKLRGVFKIDKLGGLARRQAGGNRSEVIATFHDQRYDIGFSFSPSSKSEVVVDTMPSAWIEDVPVYLPPRELLSIYPGFVSLYETTHLPFEETWRDTSILLGAPLSKGTKTKNIRSLVQPLETAMGGTVELDYSSGFYLKTKMGRVEIYLIAEGMRKLAMLTRLTSTGALLDKGYLFWDEPETNLNPKLIKLVARAILTLCQNGIQVFIATHSLFLLRELYILHHQEFPQTDTRYIGLHPGQDGGVDVFQGMTMDEIGDITSLDEELAQSERYLDMEIA